MLSVCLYVMPYVPVGIKENKKKKTDANNKASIIVKSADLIPKMSEPSSQY